MVARGPRGRNGFTLVEVLVVLAILIILFAMLFAPMIASLDMVTIGQAKVTMQTSARNALTEMRREISNAMYVYPTPGLTYLGADGIRGTDYAGDGEMFIPNYSQIAFVSPKFSGGSVVEPLTPRTQENPLTLEDEIVTTAVMVELLDPAEAYSRDNPFVLVRKEGTTYQERSNSAGTIFWWDFDPTEEVKRNVLSPRGSYDIPATRSICTECGEVIDGYASACPGGCTGEILYEHANVQFTPERVVGETLQPNENATLFHADHDAWAGFFNHGNVELNDLSATAEFMQLGASELDPRIMLVDPFDRSVVRDTWQDVSTVVAGSRGASIVATWNSNRGVVQVGATTGRWVNVPDPGASIAPGQYYPLQIQHERPDMTTTRPIDEYDADGTLGDARDWDLIPVYPSLGPLLCPSCGTTHDPTMYNVGDPCPTSGCSGTLISTAQPGDPAMPIAYRIDPTAAGSYQPAKIVPGSVRVVVWGVDDTGRIYQTAFSETANTNQSEIGPEQFALVLSDHGQRGEVRFNELQPPSPRMLTAANIAVEDFGVYIQYYYRRNYDPARPDDDFMLRADYSTQQVMNLRLALQRYIQPEDDPDTPGAQRIPPDATIDRVALEDQVRVRNLSN